MQYIINYVEYLLYFKVAQYNDFYTLPGHVSEEKLSKRAF